jgi:hypothetical protein
MTTTLKPKDKEYLVAETNPNILSVSFTESKGSEMVNSERRRDQIALALQLAAKYSPQDFYPPSLGSLINNNIEVNYTRYE